MLLSGFVFVCTSNDCFPASLYKSDITVSVNGAVTVNGEKLTDETYKVTKQDAIEGKFIVLRRGKKKYALAKFN